MLAGVEPTGRHVKIPLVVIGHFREGKLAHDYLLGPASVLAQLGLIELATSVAGLRRLEGAQSNLPANELMKR